MVFWGMRQHRTKRNQSSYPSWGPIDVKEPGQDQQGRDTWKRSVKTMRTAQPRLLICRIRNWIHVYCFKPVSFGGSVMRQPVTDITVQGSNRGGWLKATATSSYNSPPLFMDSPEAGPVLVLRDAKMGNHASEPQAPSVRETNTQRRFQYPPGPCYRCWHQHRTESSWLPLEDQEGKLQRAASVPTWKVLPYEWEIKACPRALKRVELPGVDMLPSGGEGG